MLHNGFKTKIQSTTSRREALEGAGYVFVRRFESHLAGPGAAPEIGELLHQFSQFYYRVMVGQYVNLVAGFQHKVLVLIRE